MSTGSISSIFFSQWKCLEFGTYFNENTFSPSFREEYLQFCGLKLLWCQETTASCPSHFRFPGSYMSPVLFKNLPCKESFCQFQGLVSVSNDFQVGTDRRDMPVNCRDIWCSLSKSSFLCLSPNMRIFLYFLLWKTWPVNFASLVNLSWPEVKGWNIYLQLLNW